MTEPANRPAAVCTHDRRELADAQFATDEIDEIAHVLAARVAYFLRQHGDELLDDIAV